MGGGGKKKKKKKKTLLRGRGDVTPWACFHEKLTLSSERRKQVLVCNSCETGPDKGGEESALKQEAGKGGSCTDDIVRKKKEAEGKKGTKVRRVDYLFTPNG